MAKHFSSRSMTPEDYAKASWQVGILHRASKLPVKPVTEEEKKPETEDDSKE